MFKRGGKRSAFVLGPFKSGKTVLLCGIYWYVVQKKYTQPTSEPNLLEGIKRLENGEWPLTTDKVYTYNFVVEKNRNIINIIGVDTPGQRFNEWVDEIIRERTKSIREKMIERVGKKRENIKAVARIVAFIFGFIFFMGAIIRYLHPIFMIISIPLILVPFIIGGEREETEKKREDKGKRELGKNEFYVGLKTSKTWILTIPANIKDIVHYQVDLYNRYKSLLKIFRPERVGIVITMADLFGHEVDKRIFYGKIHYRDLENFIKDIVRDYKVFEYCVETEKVTENGKEILIPKRFPGGFKVRGVEEIIKWLLE